MRSTSRTSVLALGMASLVLAGCHSGALVIADVDAGDRDAAPEVADAGTCTHRVLFVVGSDALTSGDNALRDRLRGLGYSPVLIEGAAVTSADANGADFVFISRTIQAAAIGGLFRDLPVPLLVPEYALFPNLGMTDAKVNTDFGGVTVSVTDLVIAEPNHPLAGGLVGTRTVLTPGTGFYGFGVPGPEAAKIASLVGEDGKLAIFGYERGAAMIGLRAPARRVGWFVDKDASTRLTADGWTLFDAAVTWTAGACAP
ncbi:MAG: Thaumatin, pathosis-related protein [Myxococcales bacterium]|nr:Thaumatin, pathosis-related protein [Myxococcales bacterium]